MRIQYKNTTGSAMRTLASHPHVSVTRAPRVGGGQSTSVTESYKVHTRTLPRVRTNLSLCRCRTASCERGEICSDSASAGEVVAAIFQAMSDRFTDTSSGEAAGTNRPLVLIPQFATRPYRSDVVHQLADQ
jgi:hypothetical protein